MNYRISQAAVDGTIIEIKNSSLGRYLNTSPIAIITGSDIGVKGSPVQFNGSASTAPNNSTITKYEWDLNGDGFFDDSNSSSPPYIYMTLMYMWD